MAWWQILVFPFSILIDVLTRFRNFLYNRRILKSFGFETNLIAIGNLSMGGSGKTPMTIYLIEFLNQSGYEITTLSRGYRRKSHGFKLTTYDDTATSIGDEPYQYYLRFGEHIGVAVGEDRVLSIPDILFLRPKTQIILLDDAFQQRALRPNQNILLTRYDKPFFKDYVLPAGSLRERRSSANRADSILVTGCPKFLSEAEQVAFKYELRRFSDAPVFFTTTNYLNPQSFASHPLYPQVIGISGIANPAPFESHLAQHYTVKMTHRFPDHHVYSDSDVRAIIKELGAGISLITTEKDYVKLKQFPELKQFSCFFIPIETKFLRDETLFQSIILNSIKNYESDYQ